MSKIPEPYTTITTMIDDYHTANQSPPRPHLGASLLGHPCDRWLWLSFRWAVIEKFHGQTLRLFRRGQNEEAIVVSDLRAIGMTITNTGFEQSRVSFGSHIAGSIDGIIQSGVLGAPEKPHVLEIKTHGDKSYNDLQKHGVAKSKQQHWTQMQVYMLGTGIDRALYVAVNKNTDDLHTERVRFDKEAAEKAVARGKRITMAERMPAPLSADPTWYQCRWCPAHANCHGKMEVQEKNCRTCFHAEPLENDAWRCDKFDSEIPLDFQRVGCDDYTMHPDMYEDGFR